MISCGARLAPFDIAELREFMSYDEMELDMIGDQVKIRSPGEIETVQKTIETLSMPRWLVVKWSDS